MTALIAVMIILASTPIPPVLAYDQEEFLLTPVSGSDVDPTEFEYSGHTVAEGFAADISMDLPVPKKQTTQTKIGFAVAGLGDPWSEWILGKQYEYTPYVEEMSLKVEGDSDYTLYTGGIFDNTGTGGPSAEFLGLILLGLDFAFLAYDIYSLLEEVYEDPPVNEWQPENPTHSVEAFVWQKTEPGYYPWQQYVDPDEPRLQTAGAFFLSHFDRDLLNTLTITAQAAVYVQIVCPQTLTITYQHVGTYSVSFDVEVHVGLIEPVPVTLDISSTPCHSVVYIDDYWAGGTNDDPLTVTVTSGYHTIKARNIIYVGKRIGPRKFKTWKYAFDYWTISGRQGEQFPSNPITWPILSDGVHLTAHYYLVEIIYT